ncbi:hypothetical protein ACFL2V_11970 [Pseudomonadota bacterium]
MPSISEYSREFSWQLKTRLNYSPTLQRKPGIKSLETLLRGFNPTQQGRFNQLSGRYALHDWPRLCGTSEYIENLYVLDLLDQYLTLSKPHDPGLDIGCRNFSHLPALNAFTQYPWHGVELDGHARYWNGYTRRAYGEWIARQYPDCRYIADSLLNIKGSYSVIYWALPFVTPQPLVRWGLPTRFFQPSALLQKAWELLANNGVMLIINQGHHEAEVQQTLFSHIGIEARSTGALSSIFSPFKKTRIGWIIEKPEP